MFRFGILGAGHIAERFVAAARLAGCEVSAIAARSAERADAFAKTHGICHSFGSYKEMLESSLIDAAYIATVPSTHYPLTCLCLEKQIPVLCEKAMFRNSQEAIDAFALAKEKNTFAMEALWSKFLPVNRKAKEWIDSGRIGDAQFMNVRIGFCPPKDDTNRYFNPALDGGAATDITVYAYEIAAFLCRQRPEILCVEAVPYPTGVDAGNLVLLRDNNLLITLQTSFVADLKDSLEIFGTEGRIVIPHPHWANEAYLYTSDDSVSEHFTDDSEGFVYEIREVQHCIENGLLESHIQTHEDTIACARLFDLIHDKINATLL